MTVFYICSQKLKEKKLMAKKMKLEQKKQEEGEWYPLFLLVTFSVLIIVADLSRMRFRVWSWVADC